MSEAHRPAVTEAPLVAHLLAGHFQQWGERGVSDTTVRGALKAVSTIRETLQTIDQEESKANGEATKVKAGV